MIGKLRHRIRLMTPVRVPDGGGGADITWQVLDEVWAQVNATPSAADTSSYQDTGLLRNSVIIRYRDDLSHSLRIEIDGHDFEIISFRDLDGQKRFQKIRLQEIRA